MVIYQMQNMKSLNTKQGDELERMLR